MATSNGIGVWVGLRRCGCCVAVCVDDPAAPREPIEQTKREFLRDGLSVVYATWEAWISTHLPSLQRDCPHKGQARETPPEET